jgi:GTP-binding protein HflX
VGLVGYTNAWKSSLMRLLTKKDVLVEDKLFATLWTTTGKVFIENPVWRGKEILLTDTIWFIRDLPPQLIKAFSSTLEDSIQSDILIQVVDCTDADLYEKVNVVNDILNEIWAIQPKVYVFNKIDLLNPEQLAELEKTYAYLNPIFISTENQLWIEKLKGRIDEMSR